MRLSQHMKFAVGVLAVIGCAIAQQDKLRRLKTVAVDARDYRLGLGLRGDIPKKAYRVRVGEDSLHLWDLDGDGRLTIGTDGLSLDPLPFIVRIPEVLLLREGQYRLAFRRDSHVRMTPDELDLPKEFVSQCATLTRVRMAHGKQPLRLDGPASKGCALHCNYLHLNPPSDVSMAAHDEDPKCRGYTVEGAAAGKWSCVSPLADVQVSLAWNAATIWHAEPVMDPDATAFGCASAHGWTLLRPIGGSRSIPFMHPADGADAVPCQFGPGGEYPNPVPGTAYAQTCGHPIFVRLKEGVGRLTGALVVDENGNEVAGTTSCPKAPATNDWPANSGCAVFVPSMPLRPGMRYRVTFAFEAGQMVKWEFRTRSAEDHRLKAWRYTPMPEVVFFDPREFIGESPTKQRVPPTPSSKPVLPSWVPKLRLGEIKVVKDPSGGWWYVESRSNDNGLLSLHAYGSGAEAKARAEEFAKIVRRDRNHNVPRELRDRRNGR